MKNIFERASKQKLRFSTNRGALNIEHLWDLSLEELNSIAVNLYKEAKTKEEISFISKRTASDTKAELQLDIVKHIIEYKMELANKRIKSAEIKARKEKLMSIIAEQEDEALKGKSITSLRKELAALEAEDES